MKVYRRFLILMFAAGVAALLFTIKSDLGSRSVQIDANVREKSVTPVGLPIGLYLHTDGVMVLDTEEVVDSNEVVHRPVDGVIMKNDYIVRFNDVKVSNKAQLIYLINENGNNEARIMIKRNNKYSTVAVNPILDKDGSYKLGIWVRDDAQGIGTLTYVTDDNEYGALGHGVADVDTGKLLNSNDGKIYMANIWGIKKGQSGEPGGLCGSIDYSDDNIMGSIGNNTEIGIYGKMSCESLSDKYGIKSYSIALKNEVKKGKACIQMIMDGKVRQYDINIKKINRNSKSKNMVIEVVDEELLNLTNGIVQGMSGSPIIQDGKVVGAVTHVFVDEPEKGYGIFIEEMLKQ